ncbi:MAG: 50S ribosomal protein L15 [Deltaproteobacteria bacterium]|nr:50S ribosomal protein L15 [Deltaproteobacteria bacterium]
MDLSSISPSSGATKKRKRVGRGNASGHGGTSGKGHKGQKARSGGKVRRGFEGGQMPMARRLPKRGFSNHMRKDIVAINVEDISLFPAGTVVTEKVLLENGIIKKLGDGVKLLGNGLLENSLIIELSFISKGAREKILAAGGSVSEGLAE